MRILLLFSTLLSFAEARAQFFRFAPGPDTTRAVTLEGYADVYYGYDFSEPEPADRPYFVNHHRHGEVAINLAYLSARYTSQRARAVFTPGFGTYMNANYAAERGTLRNIFEANVGMKLSRAKAVWLDAGVLPSPYTNETAISFDQPTLTRSFAPEFVPYYLSGARLSFPLSAKATASVYLLNGWQQIEDVNAPNSFGSSVEWRPDTAFTAYLNTYVGNEQSDAMPDNRTRYFVDAYFIWRLSWQWSLTACAYAGAQSRADTVSVYQVRRGWGQANATARYAWNRRSSVSVRAEYFRDPSEVVLKPVTTLMPTNIIGFKCFSASLGYNVYAAPAVMLRAEARYFQSPRRGVHPRRH